MMEYRIRFGVVGLGHIGKRHAKLISQNNQAELVAVCDVLSPDQLGWDINGVPFFNSLHEMLRSGVDIDVINICTPNGLHALQAIEALSSGKHVVIEKPMALYKADAENIIFRALQVSRSVFTVMQNRYSPAAKWLYQMVHQGGLGKIYMVQMNCFWNRDHRYYTKGGWHGTSNLDGGVLYTQFSHFIDILYWLFGDICNLRGNFRNFSHQHSTSFEDTGSVVFELVKGGMGSLNYSTATWDKNLESSITIIAENGSVKVSGQYMNRVVDCHVKGYNMPELEEGNPPNDYGGYQGTASNHAEVIQNVINTLKGETEIATNALEGLKVVEIIENIYKIRGAGELVQ